jgi:hypothetical protein
VVLRDDQLVSEVLRFQCQEASAVPRMLPFVSNRR